MSLSVLICWLFFIKTHHGASRVPLPAQQVWGEASIPPWTRCKPCARAKR